MTAAEEPSDVPAADSSGRLGGPFHRFWAAVTASNLADGMLATALPLVAAALTNDPLLVSGLLVARYLPWLLLAPLSGVLADRVDRARAMAAANTVRALALAVLAALVATGNAGIWTLYAVMFTAICCETVYDVAARALLPRLVDSRRLDRANSRLEGGRVVAEQCAGAPVAGVLFAVAALVPLATIAGAYALGALLLLAIPLTTRRPPERPAAPAGPVAEAAAGGGRTAVLAGVRRDLGEGFGYLLAVPALRNMMIANGGLNIGLQMGTAVLVLFVQRHLGVPAALYGVFITSMALGALAGSFVTARLVAAAGRSAVLRAGLLGTAAAILGTGISPGPYPAALCWAAAGFCLVGVNIAVAFVFQTSVPDELRGRVTGAFRSLSWGLAPVGALLGGLLGRIDLRLPFVAGACVLALVLVLFWRTFGRVVHLAQEAADTGRG